MKKVLTFIVISIFSFLNISYIANAGQSIACSKNKIGQIVGTKVCSKVGSVYRLVDNTPPKNNVKQPITSSPNNILPKQPNKTIKSLNYQVAYSKLDIKNNNANINISLYISDAAKQRNYNDYLDALNLAINQWQPYLSNSDISVILFTENDSFWVDNTQTRLMGSFLSNPNAQLQSNRIKKYGCSLAGFYLPNIILACVQNNNLASSSTALAHEYTHLVGMTSKQISSFNLGDSRRLKPCWIEEGLATFYGFYTESKLDPEFENNRSNFLNSLSSNMNINLKETTINTFHDTEQNMDTCTKVEEAYFLGSIAFEQLTYQYGIEKVLQFNYLFYSGLDWKITFNQIFGLTTESFYDTISTIVVSKSWNN